MSFSDLLGDLFRRQRHTCKYYKIGSEFGTTFCVLKRYLNSLLSEKKERTYLFGKRL